MEQRLELGFDALDKALRRVSKFGSEQQFAPLAESLLWLVMINDAFWEEDEPTYRNVRENDPAGKTIEGLRYARHRLVHDIRVYGLHGVINHIGGYADGYAGRTEWRWRDIDELADAQDNEGEDVYREYLLGHEFKPSLRAAASFLADYHHNRGAAGGE